jgi:hypothetical protein
LNENKLDVCIKIEKKFENEIIYFLVICSETAVVAPLETLNTNLNYKILDDFIGKITDSTTKFYSTILVNNNTNNQNNNISSTQPIPVPYG